MRQALGPFHNPKLRHTILNAKRKTEQVIDEQTLDLSPLPGLEGGILG